MSICSETYTKLRAKFGTCRKPFQQLPRKTDYLCVLYCRECYQLKRKKVKILGLGAFFALTLVAMEQNQKTLVRLSKQNKTREEHKKLSICSAKKGKHTCRVRIVQNGVFVIVMIRCGFLFWREQSNLIDKGQIWSSCLQIHQPYTECTDSKARSCHISSVADTQDLKGYRYSCGAVIVTFQFVWQLHLLRYWRYMCC